VGARVRSMRDADGGESEKGAWQRAVAFIGVAVDREEEGWGVWGDVRVEERGGGLARQSAADTDPWLMGAGEQCARAWCGTEQGRLGDDEQATAIVPAG
jgi:hypothetical protein